MSSEEKSGKRLQRYRVIKRIGDVVISVCALVVLLPVLLLVCLVILADDPHAGPIYAQRRCGLDGKVFWMYKFRTMVHDADERLKELQAQNECDGPVFKMKNDPRITKVGKFLRKTCIDELPQFVNVLLGQMSVVGPRPPLPQEVALYRAQHWARLSVKPGLTCIWQVAPGKHSMDFDRWVELDVEYIRTRSVLLDTKLILKTVRVMLAAEGQ